MSKSEWTTLAGLALIVFGCSQKWSSSPPKQLSAVGAEYVSKFNFSRTAYDLPIGNLNVGLVLVFCSVIAASLLLLDAYNAQRTLQRNFHIGSGAVVIALSVLNFSISIGMVLAITGGILIVIGGTDRYRLS